MQVLDLQTESGDPASRQGEVLCDEGASYRYKQNKTNSLYAIAEVLLR